MSRRRSFKPRRLRRVPLLKRWWSDLLYRWRTSRRVPWILAGVSAMVLTLFASVMHAMVRGDVQRRELTYLAMNVYYESRGEPLEGQYGVAEVTMNRVADPRYPDTVCEVVYQKRWDYLRKRDVSAFSWTEFDMVPHPEGTAWESAKLVARATLRGERQPMLDGAVHYHSVYIRPSWSAGRKPVARIGRHVFYH